MGARIEGKKVAGGRKRRRKHERMKRTGEG